MKATTYPKLMAARVASSHRSVLGVGNVKLPAAYVDGSGLDRAPGGGVRACGFITLSGGLAGDVSRPWRAG